LAARPGDLYVVIHVAEHEQFERQGNNLYASVPITFAQAALGADVKVLTLGGDESLKIPAGTQTGTVFRVRGQGMPVLAGVARAISSFLFRYYADDFDARATETA